MSAFADSSQVFPLAEASVRRVTPDELARTFSGPADLSSNQVEWPQAILRRWTGTAPTMTILPLDHHLICQHLAGAKRCERKGDGAPVSSIVECGSLSIVPAGAEFNWHTQGPIGFAHLYISPARLTAAAARFDRANALSLVDRVGCRDPLLETLYTALLEGVQNAGDASVLFLDSLFETFLLKLLHDHSTATLRPPKQRESLPAYRLKRVIDFIEANLDQQLSLTDLAEVAGGSVFHFSRAFRNSQGDPPYRYVLRRRMEQAKSLLTSSNLPLNDIARLCGFQSAARFSKAFTRLIGVGPEQFRRG